jgi:hypothetical protein
MATLVVEDGTGLTTSNAYCTPDEADLYHEMRLHNATWAATGDDDKEAAIMWATKLLDNNITFDGWKYTEDQALAWPRDGVLDRDGYEIDIDEIPQFLKDATAEFAFWLIASDPTADDSSKGYKRIKAGSLELEVNRWDRKGIVPRAVWSIIRFCSVKSASKSKTTVRV